MSITHTVYVSYGEAQKLIPIFEYYAREGQWKDLRQDARFILEELRGARSVDYSPLPGYQMFLSKEQYEFFNDVRSEVA